VGAFPVAVVDTTGAGDSFNAGFLHTWLRGEKLADCMRFASVCGSLSTRGMGGTAAQPREEEVRRCFEAETSA
jgi:sugar/nucleoside kinase (ribokinase family)